MEVIKRKILLENYTNRIKDSDDYGKLTAYTFNFKIFLTQKYDDMGMFTDVDYIEDETSNGFFDNILRYQGTKSSDFWNYGETYVTGLTESKITDVKSYGKFTPYVSGFDIRKETYINYKGEEIESVDRVIDSINLIYTFDAVDDNKLGGDEQETGILYMDYPDTFREVLINNTIVTIPVTTFRYRTQGWNETNTGLSASTKEEFLFGITFKPEIQSDVFIERGVNTVFDKHLKLSEITNILQFEKYNQGYYNIKKV